MISLPSQASRIGPAVDFSFSSWRRPLRCWSWLPLGTDPFSLWAERPQTGCFCGSVDVLKRPADHKKRLAAASPVLYDEDTFSLPPVLCMKTSETMWKNCWRMNPVPLTPGFTCRAARSVVKSSKRCESFRACSQMPLLRGWSPIPCSTHECKRGSSACVGTRLVMFF